MVTNLLSTGGSPEVLAKRKSSILIVPPGRIRKHESIGYDLQRSAAEAIGLWALHYGEQRILVFGLPGSGVRGFVEAVLWELKTNYGVQILQIVFSCERLIVEFEIEEILKDFEKKIEDALKWNTEGNRLVVLTIERPESLSSEIKNFQRNKGIVTVWLSSFLRKHYNKTLMFCTSDDPSSIDASLIRLCKIPIYLSPLDSKGIRTLLVRKLTRKDSAKIAEMLYNDVNKDRFRLVSAEVVKAIERIRTPIKDFESLPIDQAVKRIRRRVYPCYPLEDVKNYEERNRELILYFKNFVMNYWPKKLQKFQKQVGSE